MSAQVGLRKPKCKNGLFAMTTDTLLLSIVCRSSSRDGPSGYVYTLDLGRRQVTGRSPVSEPLHFRHDENPRGGMRGARGIAVVDDHVFIANFSGIHRFDSAWRLIGAMSHPSCADIHDVRFREGRLWVTSTRNDLIFEFDLDGDIHQCLDLRNFRELGTTLHGKEPRYLTDTDIFSGTTDFRDPRSHDRLRSDSMHVNSVCFLPDGAMLILLGRLRPSPTAFLPAFKAALERCGWWTPLLRASRALLQKLHLEKTRVTREAVDLLTGQAVIVRIGPDGKFSIPLMLHRATHPAHSLCAQQDGTVLFNDTTTAEIVHLDPNTHAVLSRMKVAGPFLRGIARLANDLTVVGNQNHLYVIDLPKQVIVDQIQISEDPQEAIFDIKVLPPSFQPLPERLVP